MLRIALTGGIASGKSAAAAAFRDLGVPVIDTDRIARDVVAYGARGLADLVAEFGRDILDNNGELDRARLREIIFSNATLRQRVNAILHPRILDVLEQELAVMNAPYSIVEIPLLVETGLAHAFDRVLVVDADEDVRIERLQMRDGVSEAEARAALDAQATRAERLQHADDVIENNGSLDALRAAVRALHGGYIREADRFAPVSKRPAE